MLNTGVERIEKDKVLQLHLSGQISIDADLVILCIGVSPENKLAIQANLKVGSRGGILVNEQYETSASDIYAVGDAIEVKHFVTGTATMIPLAGPANKQGRTVASIIAGNKKHRNLAVQGSSVLKVFELTAASTGMNEKQLKQENIAYHKTYVHPSSHASYYPGATPISMKLLFSSDGSILGAQAVGREGVEKRIDVIATALRLKGTVYDLEELELCYAPPYSSAKDPVNMIGFTAANILRGQTKVFYAEEIPSMELDKITLLDVSTAEEFMIGSIDGARNIPVDELRNRIEELPKEKPVYVFCRVGLRGYVAACMLEQKGYEVYNLSGGYKTYTMVFGNKLEPIKLDCIGIRKVSEMNQLANEDRAKQVANRIEVDACGLQCPGPIMKVAESMKSLKEGEQLLIRATDPAFVSDVQVWCQRTGNQFIDNKKDNKVYEVVLQKGVSDLVVTNQVSAGNDKTMVVFSGDLDKAIATFIIANGAAAMGRNITLFFTFWGLNILRRPERVKVSKNIVEKMFGIMMPRGSKKLGLSRMNMGGMGAKMIRMVMKSKNVQSLEELMQAAMDNGVRIVACQMSMDVMGIRREELIDGVEVGGVATFLGSAETSDMNLFI
jgi:peroxiredoxin family protein/TusA-related sulfurtransferase/rhodanese-related sulfurtransferase